MIRKLIKRWRDAHMYITVDPQDNSISFSKRLFRYITRHAKTDAQAQAYVFRIPERNAYAFVISPDSDQPLWPLCNIQVNDQHHTIGFESLCPTVNRICYEYDLPLGPTKLSVDIQHIAIQTTYIIQRPKQ